MSKFNWEKQNKAEQPKEKRRVSNRSKVLRAYENGSKRERERIILLLDKLDISFSTEENCSFVVGDAWDLIQLIKGEHKCVKGIADRV